MRHNPDAKITMVERQFNVTRDRLRTRVHGGSGKRGPKIPSTKLLAAEESANCRYIDRLDRISLAVRAEFITDAANYVLSHRSSSLETVHTVGKNWTTRFIMRHNYKKPLQKTLDSGREASEDLDRVNKYFKKLDNVIRNESIVPDDIWNMDKTGFCIGPAKIKW